MTKQAQLHTSIPPELMAKFKKLCKSMTYPISVSMGVKQLIKQSVERQKLPGMPSNMTLANRRAFKYLIMDINNDGLDSIPDVQHDVVSDIKRVANVVIPVHNGGIHLYWLTAANLYLQVLMIEVAVDRTALIPYLEAAVGNAYWPKSALAYLKLVNNINDSKLFTNFRYNKQTWFDASASLVHKYSVLNKRWKHLMTTLTVMDDCSLIHQIKPVLNWHIYIYIHNHVGNPLEFNHCTPDLHLEPDRKKSLAKIIGNIQDLVATTFNS